MKRSYNRKLILIAAAITVVVSFLIHFMFSGIEDFIYDLTLGSKKKSSPEEVVIVGVDAKSIRELGVWPWSRSDIAKVVENIGKQNPKSLAVDMVFPKNSRDSVGTERLVSAFSHVPGLVLGMEMSDVKRENSFELISTSEALKRHSFYMLDNEDGISSYVAYFASTVNMSDSMIAQYGVRGGFLNVSSSKHSYKIRQLVHVLGVGEDYYPSLGLAGAAEYLSLKKSEFVFSGDGKIVLGDRSIPIGSASQILLNFRGKPGTIKTYSAIDVINGDISTDAFRGKLVFLGITDAPALPSDFFRTPGGIQFPGVELWATSAADIIESRWITKNSIVLIIALLIFLLINPGLFFIFSAKSKRVVPIIGGLIFLLSVVVGYFLINYFGIYWNSGIHFYAFASIVLLTSIRKNDIIIIKKESAKLYPDYDKIETIDSRESSSVDIPSTETAKFVVAAIKEESSDSISEEEIFQKYSIIDKSEIVRHLGTGGMADVYLMWHPRMEVLRALKAIKPGQPTQWLERFETEIKVFSSLSHPNIVQCYGAGYWYSLPYLEMEYIRGKSLEDILREFGPVDVKATLAIGILTCKALSYAHNCTITAHGQQFRGVIHRDLKPANILFSNFGEIKVADFGIARLGADRVQQSKSTKIVGTLPYLAPEQFEGDAATSASDIYALGATLYEIISGRKVFPQTDIPSLIAAKKSDDFINPEILNMPQELAAILNKSLALKPSERYTSASEMEKALVDMLSKIDLNEGDFIFKELIVRIFQKK